MFSGVRNATPLLLLTPLSLRVHHLRYENRDVPDSQTYNTMRTAFQNLLYPYRDPDKMF